MKEPPDLESADFTDLGASMKGAIRRAWARFEHRDPDHADFGASSDELLQTLVKRGVPKILAERIANDAVVASKAVTEAQQCRKPTLVLAGPEGSGRSQAAALWMTGRGKRLWVWSYQLLRLRRDFQADKALWRECVFASVLAVDDLGCEASKGHSAERSRPFLDELLTRRLGDGLRTVFTTPLSKPDFVERYGARIWTKIIDNGRFVEMTGPWGRGGDGSRVGS